MGQVLQIHRRKHYSITRQRTIERLEEAISRTEMLLLDLRLEHLRQLRLQVEEKESRLDRGGE